MSLPPSVRRAVARRSVFLTVLLFIATALAASAKWFWFAELFSHFTPWYAVLALPCLLVLLASRRWCWAAVAAALVLWNAYPAALQLSARPPYAPPAPHEITIFHFNVGLHHESPQRITTHLMRRAKLIDVIVLLEATDAFGAVLDELREAFPHQVRQLENSPFGIAVASRFPMDAGQVSKEPSGMFAHIEAMLRLPGRDAPLALYAVHAPPPISGEMAQARNRKLEAIARKAAVQPQATPIVVGDFNLTPWSPYFQQFIADSGLRDVRTPHRFEHTWPVTFNNAHLGLAIDHSFAHPSLQLIKRGTGPDLGSDHLPVTVTFGY